MILDSFSFDANALDPDCPSADSTDGSEAAAMVERRLRLLADSGPNLSQFHARFNGNANGSAGGPMSYTVAPDLRSGSFSTSLSRFASAFEAQGAPLPDNVLPGYALAYAHDGSASGSPASQRTDIWIKGRYSSYTDDLAGADRKGQFAVAYAGVDHLITDNVLIGVMGSVDFTKESSDLLTSDGEGLGWMAGPYASVKLAPQLYFDIRAAWGQSTNDMTVDDDPGSFDTDRWLVKADLTGAFDHGPWRFGPTAGVAYIEELQKAYTTEGGTEVPERKAYLGRVHFGPTIAYRHEASDGTVLEPHVTFLGVWDFDSSGTLTLDEVTATSTDLSATLKAGFTATTAAGATLGVEVIYDGLFADEYEALGGRATVSVPLR